MNNFEMLVASRPQLNVIISKTMPKSLGGLTFIKDIYINKNRTEREKYEILQEEFAHYDYSVGDISSYSSEADKKQEALARSKAMERSVTFDGLIYCFYHDLWSLEEVSDYFGVTEEYLQKAINNYRAKYGLVFRYSGYYFDLRNAININKI
ncbi:toxin [Limosilactobacillus pontis]|uniref:toxin n=1 Tax=Limosilactobacillus pontis TaxID=35787 RepID=UPI002F26C9B3